MQPPYQKLYHQSSSYLHLKTFGCICYPWTAYTWNNKLDPKSSTCIFLGYSSDHKGYRCFDHHTSKLITSRHVCLHEHEFPMAQQPNTIPPPQISTIHNPLPPLSTPTFHPPPPSSTPPPNRLPTNPTPPPLPPARPTPTFNTNAATLHPPLSQPPHSPLSSPYQSHPPLHLPKPTEPPPLTL